MKKKRKTKIKKRARRGKGLVFPKRLLQPIANFLSSRLHSLRKTKKQVEKDDPFKDTSRILDNASPDTDAQEQYGHAKTSAIKGTLDKKMIQTKRALARIKIGKYGICEDCGEMINTDRLMVYPEATLCTKCKAKREK